MDNEQLKEIVGWLKETADQSSEFVQEQAPLVAQEIVAWQFWGGLVQLSMSLIVLAACVIIGFWIALQVKKKRPGFWCQTLHEPDPVLVVPGMVLLISIVGCSLSACRAASSVAQALVAPRLVILDYISGLV